MADVAQLLAQALNTVQAPESAAVDEGYIDGARADTGLQRDLDPLAIANQSWLDTIGSHKGYSSYVSDASRMRTGWQRAGDSAIDVTNGVVQGGLGLVGLGAGVFSDDAGTAVAGFSSDANEWFARQQSDALNARRRARDARNLVTQADNKIREQNEINNGSNAFVAGLRRIGRDAFDAVANEDGETLVSGVANAGGSLVVGGLGGKALRLAGLGKAALSTSIGLQEAGGAYNDVVSSIMLLNDDELRAGSPEYAQLVDSGMDPVQAKKQIANQAGLMAAPVQGVAGAVLGKLVPFEEHFLRQGGLTRLAGNTVREALEEGGQSLTGGLVGNAAVKYNANDKQDLVDGVGVQVGQGALYGAMSAGVTGAPGSVVESGVNAGKKAYASARRDMQFLAGQFTDAFNGLKARGAEILDRQAEAGPMSATNIELRNEMAAEAVTPEIRDAMIQTVEASNVPDEQKQADVDYIDRVVKQITIDPLEVETQSSPLVREALGSSSNRLQALTKLANMVSNQQGSTDDRLDASIYLLQEFNNRQQLLDQDMPEALNSMSPDDPVRAHLDLMGSSLLDSLSHPALSAAFEKAKAAIKQVNNSAEKGSSPRIMQHAVNAMAAAPDLMSVKTAQRILQQADNGDLNIDEGRLKVALANAVTKVAVDSNEQSTKKLGLRKSETVSSNIAGRRVKGDNNGMPSILDLRDSFIQSYKDNDATRAQAILVYMQKLAQHMANKVEALNQHYANGNPEKSAAVPYMGLVKGRFVASEDGLWVNPIAPASIRTAQRVEADAKTVIDVANGLARFFPELGVKPLADGAGKLHPNLAGKAEQVADEHKSGRRTSGSKPKAAAEAQPVEQAPAATDARASQSEGQQAEPQAANEAPGNDAGQTSAADVLDLTDQLKVDAEPVQKTKEPADKPADKPAEKPAEKSVDKVVDKQADEPAPQSTPEQVAEPVAAPSEGVQAQETTTTEKPQASTEEVVDEAGTAEAAATDIYAKGLTLADRFPSLHSTKSIPNRFLEAFRLPEKPISRLLAQSGNVLQSVVNALKSKTTLDAFVGFSTNVDKPRANALRYTIDQVTPVMVDVLNRLTTAKLKQKNGKSLVEDALAGKVANSDPTRWVEGRLFGLVEQQDDGSFKLNQDIAEMASLGAIDWLVTAPLKNGGSTSKQINRMLGREEDSPVSDEIYSFFNNGLWEVAGKRNLASNIQKFLGVKDNKSVPMGHTRGIPEALAAALLEAMTNTGLIRLAEMTIDGTNYSVLQFAENTVDNKLNDALALLRKAAPDMLNNIALTDPETVFNIGQPPKNVPQSQMRNPLIKLTEQQKSAIKIEQAVPHKLNMPMIKAAQALGKAGMVALFGGQARTDTMLDVVANSEKSKSSLVESTMDTLEAMLSHAEEWAKQNEKAVEDSEFFYNFNFSRVNRLHMQGRNNPQGNKLMREMILPTFATVDMLDDKNYTHFMLAVGQHLGVKVHRQSPAKTIADVQQLMGQPEMQALTGMLQKWMGDGSKPFTAEQIDLIRAGLGKELSMGALHAVMDYVRYQADPNNAAFETSLYLEADGVTNGVINALALYSVGDFNGDWIRNMARGGLSFGDAKSYAQIIETATAEGRDEDTRDFYTVTADDTVTNVRNLYKDLKDPHLQARLEDMLSVMSTLLDGDVLLRNVDGRDELVISRNLLKNPTTVSVYGSGIKGIAEKVSEALVDALHRKLSNGMDENLIRQFNSLGSYRVAKGKEGLEEQGTRVSYDHGTGTKFEVNRGFRDQLRRNIQALFVNGMHAAIDRQLSDVQPATNAMMTATQVQAAVVGHAFRKLVKERMQVREKSADFLSENELRDIYTELQGLSPIISTGTQNFLLQGSQVNELRAEKKDGTKGEGVQFGRSPSGKFRSPAYIQIPGPAGVKAKPNLTIGSGDGSMMQNNIIDPASPKNVLRVFDGLNLGMSDIELGSRLINQAVFNSWGQNPVKDVAESFREFGNNLDRTLLTAEVLATVVEETKMELKDDEVFDLAAFEDYISELQTELDSHALDIDARHEVLKSVKLSVDQMASGASPHVQADGLDLTGLTPDQQAEQLNRLLAEKRAELKAKDQNRTVSENISTDIAKLGTVNASGARVIGMSELRRAIYNMAIPTEQKEMLKAVMKELWDKPVTVVHGSLDQIITDRANAGLEPLPPMTGAKGLMIPDENIVYLISPSSETLTHELIHAATINRVTSYYANDGQLTDVQKDAVERLERLMHEWLANGPDNASDRRSWNNAKQAIDAMLAENDPAAALNEFMAWTLTNASLVKDGRKTKVSDKLARLGKQVISLLKRLLWSTTKAPTVGDDFYSNIRFNTLVLMQGGSVETEILNKMLFHRTGENSRLDMLRTKYANAIAGWIAKNPLDGLARQIATTDMLAEAAQVSSTADVSGFPMNDAERSAFETIWAATMTVDTLDASSFSRAQQVFRSTIFQSTVEDFMDNPDTDHPADRARAQYRRDFLTGLAGMKNNEGKSSLLSTFIALGSVQPDMRKLMSRLQVPVTAKSDEKTLDAYIDNGAIAATDYVSRMLVGEHKNSNVRQAVDNLALQLINNALSNPTRVEQAINRGNNVINAANDKLAEAIDRGAQKVAAKANEVKQDSSNKLAKAAAGAVELAAAFVSKSTAESVASLWTAMINQEGFNTSLREVIGDIIGRTQSNKAVFDMIKIVRSMVQQTRQQFREQMPLQIAKAFKVKPSDEQWSAMDRALIRTDIAALAFGRTVPELIELLGNDQGIDREISDIEEKLKGLNPTFNDRWVAAAKSIADFMNGKPPVANQYRNATAAAHLLEQLGKTERKALGTPSDTIVDLIDQLASLYAYKGLDGAVRSTMQDLIENEPDGLDVLVAHLRANHKEEHDKLTGYGMVARFNYNKGYAPLDSGSSKSLKVFPDTEYGKLVAMGWVQVAPYKGSAAERGERKSYYFHPNGQRGKFNQGIFQNVRTTIFGADPKSGFSVGIPRAGQIVDPKVVNQIRRQLKLNQGSEALLPVYDANGQISGFERLMDPDRLAQLDFDTHAGKVIGKWRGRFIEEKMAQRINDELINKLGDMWEEGRKTEADQYINLLDPKAKLDPVVQDALSLLTNDSYRSLRERFGKDTFWVRRDMLNDVLGYRSASVGDLWTGVSRWNEPARQTARDVVTGIFGPKAYGMLVNSEKVLKTFVTDAKMTIVVRSVIVPTANMVSNVYHMLSRGVNPVAIAKGSVVKTNELNRFIADKVRRIELEGLAREAEGRNDQVTAARHRKEARSILDANRRMSIWPLIEAGEFASVNDAGVDHEDIDLAEGKLSAAIEKWTAKLPDGMRTAARYGFISRDTSLFKGLQRAVEYGDFIAKAIMYDHLTGEKQMSKEDALGQITEEFVNYDRLPGRGRGYLEDIGMLWFWHFKLRAVKVAASVMRNNPLNMVLAHALPMPDVLGVGTPFTDNLFSQFASGSLNYSTGPMMGVHSLALNPWVNLFN